MLNSREGYTLIELIVVIVLIGLIMTLSLPRFQYSMLTDDLKGSTRRMVGTIRSLRDVALREQRAYDLRIDLESNSFWIDSPAMTENERATAREKASCLPEGVHILDVWYSGEGKKMMGETFIRFNRKGYIRPSVIHLGSDDGRRFTLVLSPFLGKIEMLEEYVDFEEI